VTRNLRLIVLVAFVASSRGVRADDAKETPSGKHKASDVVLEPASMTPQGGSKVDYEQGLLFVPENRSDPKSRLIRVGFARFRAKTSTPALPIFYLPGGPGISFLVDVTRAYRGFEPYLAVADVIVFDQRGYSPRGGTLSFKHHADGAPLDQPTDLHVETTRYVALAKAAVADAAKRGIDFRGYTVLECSDDVDDLRKALGYKQITLVGTSFGSQWSFAIMRRHKDVIARALLSGVEPLDGGYDMPSQVFAAIQRSWWEAEKDTALKPYLPPGGLTEAAREVMKRLEREPAKVKTTVAGGGEVEVVLGRQDLQRDFLRQSEPASLLALYHGHYGDWAKLVAARRRERDATIHPIGPLIDTSIGVTPKRLFQLRTDPGIEFVGQWNWDDYVATAGIWPTADIGDDLRTEIPCSIPVVFAQGDWDTSTPIENLMIVAPYFKNGRVLVAEHGGHGVLGPIARAKPEVMKTLLEFVRTGDVSGVPPRVELPVPKFRVPNFPPPSASGG
jgi:pimeloyl-ACP methyl ester carboxylesterase